MEALLLTHLGMHGLNKARQCSCPTSPPTQKKAGGGMKEGGEGRPLSPKPIYSVYSWCVCWAVFQEWCHRHLGLDNSLVGGGGRCPVQYRVFSRISGFYPLEMPVANSQLPSVTKSLWWLRCKESACNAGDWGSIPALGRSPGEGKGYPPQYCGLENSGSQRIRHDKATFTQSCIQNISSCGQMAPIEKHCMSDS